MKARVLIVDDEPFMRRVMSSFLVQAGYDCETASDGAEARRALAERSFDLLLTDINMPGESGAALARFVKEQYKKTAVVMATVIDNLELAREILDIGVYGYIIKPFTNNLVLITVENALRRQRLEMQEQVNIELLEEKVKERTKILDEQLFLQQSLIDAIPMPLYYKGLDGRYLGCNLAFATAVQTSRSAIIGKTVMDILPLELADFLKNKDDELLRSGGTQLYEHEFPYSGRSPRIAIIRKATFKDTEGHIAGLVGVSLDISKLRGAEQALRASEEKLRSIMDNLQIGVVMIDTNMKVLEINRQVERWFPQARDASGLLCFQVFLGRDQRVPCESCPSRDVFSLGKSTEACLTRQTAQGERVFRVLASPIHDDTGTIVAALELLEDVTESLAAERELRQAQKLEAVGQLAAGIAHEINTPIQYVGDNIRFLEQAFTDLVDTHNQYAFFMQQVKPQGVETDLIAAIEKKVAALDIGFLIDELPKTIEQSLEGVDRVATIVRAMREFSHPGTSEKIHVDLNRALENTATISRNEWKYVAEVETDFDPELPPVLCLPGEMNQVFLNIVVNAAHAIGDVTDGGNKDKGRIRLSTRACDGMAEIRISDTGGGVPETIRDRIFDPFFTTKKVGKGTGQGLAIARSVVVDKHQGTIRFETESGRGTTFIIQLPPGEAS